MKKILFLILLFFPIISYSSDCTLITLEKKQFKNKQLNNLQNTLYSYYIQEKKYIGSDNGKLQSLGCKLNESFVSLNDIYPTLRKLELYIQIKNKKEIELQVKKLSQQIKSFVILKNTYKKSKNDYEELLLIKENEVKKEETIKIDTNIDSNIPTNSTGNIKKEIEEIVTFNNEEDILKRFSYKGKNSYFSVSGSIEYYLVDDKNKIELLIQQRKIKEPFLFYLLQNKKYGIINLEKYTIKNYLSLEELKSKLGSYIENSITRGNIKEDLVSLSQLYLIPITINGKNGIIGNKINKSYIFNDKNSLENFLQPFSDEILKNFLVVKIGNSYHVIKIKILDQEIIKGLKNNLDGNVELKGLFTKLDSFKNEIFDDLTFSIKDSEKELEIKRNPVFTGISNIFIGYVDNIDYLTQLQDYLQNNTTISFGTDITLYYNKVDNMKQLLSDKLNELSTYQYIADNIKSSILDKGIFNINALTGDEEIIFKTYKWISENIVYDEKVKDDITKLGSSLENNKSHYGIYTLKNKLGVCDGISILFADLLKINGISSKIIVGKNNQSGIGHALVKIGDFYYDPSNEIVKMKSLNQKTLLKGTEAFYKMPETQLKTYFTETKENNFKTIGTGILRENIIKNIKDILNSNPGYVLYMLGVKDKGLVSDSTLTDVTDWNTEFSKTSSIYNSNYFEYIKTKPIEQEYILFSGKKSESLKVYFIYAYLKGYKYYYYHPVYNEIQFFSSK